MNIPTLIMAAAACAALSSAAVEVKVDWNAPVGPVKPVNGVGQPPMIGAPTDFPMMHYLKEAGIPFARLHDVGGTYGQLRYVDIPNVFRDFSADENDPKNYSFAYTDALMKALDANGVEPFFRLGVTIDNASGKGYPGYFVNPPPDFAKWARVCEHVIRHYTEGWANGFRMKVSHWEIWNEPDNEPDANANPMWKAPFSEYIRFYGTVAPYLKEKFPHLKIGGFASCGFYAAVGAKWVSSAHMSKRTEHFIDCAEEFLAAVKKNGWPLDFFSYHSYSSPNDAMKEVDYADALLNRHGFPRERTARICNEWLCHAAHANLGSARQAVGIAAEIVGFQNGPCDIACIYDARCGVGTYSPLFNPLTYKPHKAYGAFLAFNELRRLGTAVKVEVAGEKGVCAAAATGRNDRALLIVNDSDSDVPLKLATFDGPFVCRLTDETRDYAAVPLPSALPKRSFLLVSSAPFVWTQPLVAFWEGTDFLGRDAFECGCTHRVANGRLTLKGNAATVRVKPFPYAPQKPFPGPTAVVAKAEGVPPRAQAVLRVKTQERGAKSVEFKATWKDGQALFKTALDARRTYVFDSLDFVSPNAVPIGAVTLTAVEGRYETPFAEALACEVVTASPLSVLDWHSTEEARARLRNRSNRPLSVAGELDVRDFYGRAFEIPVAAVVPPQGAVEVALPRAAGKVDAKGVWRVVAKLKASDGSTCAREDRFAVLDEHAVTPKLPYGMFRPGIHCHSARWLDADRELTHDAAVRMGAKIVRIDDVFSQFVTWDAAKKDYDFAKADRFLEGLEKRGLAVDAIIQECGFAHFTEDYCERFARHFGERIDYYEVGNEWDIASPSWLTPDQAVGWQKLAYRALKRGCPKARVTTNGWAVEDSNGHASVTQKGFQEKFMAETKGFYDMHAMHLHFPFRDFVDRMGRFFKLREACGVTEPFILNETALDVRYRGEEEVAENVWQKIVYAWAHGAKDHVWYNMRASAYDPGGNYGVVNREFRPRLTFAAFSALTAVLGDHDFDRTLVEKEGRMVYRFRRRNGGETVLVGWDTGLMKPVDVKVETDAARVWAADVMNNRRPLPLKDGHATISLAAVPQAWTFEGATTLEPAEELGAAEKAPPRVIHVSPVRLDYGWDMRLDKYAQVHEEYPADPLTAQRTWKGPDDCSGIVLFTLKDGKAALRISVKDEKDAPGDTVQIWRDGRDVTSSLKLKRTRHGDNRTVYEGAWPDVAACRINVRFIDDDGFGGIDGWMDYVPFKADAPDVSSWPILRFE